MKESNNEGLELGSGVLLIDKGKSLSLVLAGSSWQDQIQSTLLTAGLI